MMECKKALEEAKADVAEAEIVLRKRGIAAAHRSDAPLPNRVSSEPTFIRARSSAS